MRKYLIMNDFSDNLFYNMQLLCQIQIYEKINTNGIKFEICRPGIINQSFTRYYNRENRSKNFERIATSIQALMEIAVQNNNMGHGDKPDYRKEKCIKILKKLNDGLDNMKTTYESDMQIKITISDQMDKINHFLQSEKDCSN